MIVFVLSILFSTAIYSQVHGSIPGELVNAIKMGNYSKLPKSYFANDFFVSLDDNYIDEFLSHEIKVKKLDQFYEQIYGGIPESEVIFKKSHSGASANGKIFYQMYILEFPDHSYRITMSYELSENGFILLTLQIMERY
jgi:hypothetical protein